jgi:hypothetical protein
MEIPELRDVEREDHITDLFQNIHQRNFILTLWQPKTGRRQIAKASVLKVNKQNLTVEFSSFKSSFQFLGKDPLYIFCRRKFLVFKAKIKFHSPFKIITELPNHILVEELRENDRIDFSLLKSEQFIRITKDEKVDIGLHFFKSRLLDISDQGLAFQISGYDAQKFKTGDKLALHVFNKTKDRNFIPGKVHYIKRVNLKHRAGEFFRPISKPETVNFLSESLKVKKI